MKSTSARIDPFERSRMRRVPEALNIAGQVWVHTRSGKYWKPRSRYYGVTKQGEFMTKKEAIQPGCA
jgi:hypothetical protein